MDFSAGNTALWNFIIQLGIIAGIMIVANILRRKIPIVRKSLMPTAVLAGFLVLILRSFTGNLVDTGLMEMITYHTIAIGFIALSLQVIPPKNEKYKSDYTAAKSGALVVSTYLIQGFFGLVITSIFAFSLMPDLFKASGILLPLGYGQGPGQANNIGSTYEALGFQGGQSFALSIAAVGFLVACVVGVIYLNILRVKGKIVIKQSENLSGSITVEQFENKNEIPVAESVDRLSIQIALVLMVYLLTFLFSFGLTTLLKNYAPGVERTIGPLVWGFNFVIGSLFAITIRRIIKSLKNRKVMTRQYQNNYLLNRLAGFCFDLMVIAGIASINIEKLSGLWMLFVILCTVGGIVTFFYLKWMCKKLYPDYYYEGFISMFGMMTGTISSGVLLLREIDPTFETPAANNMLTASSFAILFGIPMLLLIGIAPTSDSMLFLSIGIIAAYFTGLLVFMFKFKKKSS